MRKTDLAYIAGIIDGEGCIGINAYRRNDSRKIHYRLQITVSNTNEWICQYLKMNFGGHVLYVEHTGKRKPIWRWCIYTQQALPFLTLVLPYLRLKRPQAELAISFQSARNSKGKRGKTEEHWVLEQAQYVLSRQMNRKGRKEVNDA